MIYEYSMTLRGLLQSVDAEAYASIPLFDELLVRIRQPAGQTWSSST